MQSRFITSIEEPFHGFTHDFLLAAFDSLDPKDRIDHATQVHACKIAHRLSVAICALARLRPIQLWLSAAASRSLTLYREVNTACLPIHKQKEDDQEYKFLSYNILALNLPP